MMTKNPSMSDPGPAAFWIDQGYDREHASDGVSRYAAYIRRAPFDPWTDHDQAVELAVFAWAQATTPVMSPGYVRYHPRILTAQLARSDWDGSLIARVDVLTSQPDHVRRTVGRAGSWNDWPSEYSFGSDQIVYYEPGTEDLARGPYLLASASLRFTVPSAVLEQPPVQWRGRGEYAPDALAGACAAAVAVVVMELNSFVGPVLVRAGGY
jgi:hypothetical protein